MSWLTRLQRTIVAAAFAIGFVTIGSSNEHVIAATCADPAGNLSKPSIAGNVVSNAGCQIGNSNNDSEAQLNSDAIFTFTDWDFLGKEDPVDNAGESLGTLQLNITSLGTASISGNWSIVSNAFDLFQDIALVFKGGNGGVPDNYVAYLLNSTSGTYTSPFVNTNNSNLKNISHISVYGRGVTPVPLPAALPLLGGALGLIGLLGWRRKRDLVTVLGEGFQGLEAPAAEALRAPRSAVACAREGGSMQPSI